MQQRWMNVWGEKEFKKYIWISFKKIEKFTIKIFQK